MMKGQRYSKTLDGFTRGDGFPLDFMNSSMPAKNLRMTMDKEILCTGS